MTLKAILTYIFEYLGRRRFRRPEDNSRGGGRRDETRGKVVKEKELKFKCSLCDGDEEIVHAESWYGAYRGWCKVHTPWSGHYEYCYNDPSDHCSKTLAHLRKLQ